IDTDGSAFDTVIALYPGSANVFGTNYATDASGVSVGCDDDGGSTAGASKLSPTLGVGDYYLVVKSKTVGWDKTSLPFNVSIRDSDSTGTIACASASQGSKKILQTLPAG